MIHASPSAFSSKPLAVVLLALAFVCGSLVHAEIKPEPLTVETLPNKVSPHWVWVGDMNFGGLLEGRNILIDADSGDYLGMLSTGYFTYRVVLPSHLREIYTVEIYFSRGSRGTRTDVVSIWDPVTLSLVEEIEIPAKRATGLAQWFYFGLSDNDRFLYVFNSTPAQSVSVIDMKERKFVQEIETAGCALAYPNGDRLFRMLCQDGSMMTVELDRKGKLKKKERSKPFFDVKEDPITEKASRWGDTWLFPSFHGYIYPAGGSGKEPEFGDRWSLLSDSERADNWRVGGQHYTAVHEETNTFYVLMHQGGVDSIADPGSEVWVYDLKTRKRTKRVVLKTPAISLAVGNDDDPVMTTGYYGSVIEVYNAKTGDHLRSVESGANIPVMLVAP